MLQSRRVNRSSQLLMDRSGNLAEAAGYLARVEKVSTVELLRWLVAT